MGARNTPEDSRRYAAEYRARQRAIGLVERQVWCRPEDTEAIRAYARTLAGTPDPEPEPQPEPEPAAVIPVRRPRGLFWD